MVKEELLAGERRKRWYSKQTSNEPGRDMLYESETRRYDPTTMR
jgi:hypothetical protein